MSEQGTAHWAGRSENAPLTGLPLETEEVALENLLGRVLAQDVISGEAVPGFARSTVDGYAVRARETGGASESLPVFFRVAGEVEMGKSAELMVEPGSCIYVPTGGMIPPGADAVVMVEYCEDFGADQMAIYHHVSEGKNIVMAGDDTQAGQLILRRGRKIGPADMGLLSSIGKTAATVYRPWKVAILSTGDEIVSPNQVPEPGQVRDVNSYGLYGQALKLGLSVTSMQVICDDAAALLERTRAAMEDSDLVVLSGGSSQGKKDATAWVIGQLASSGVLTHGLAVKPGKPTILGYDEPSRTALVGLPGHPVAAMLLFDLIVGGLWARMTGMEAAQKEVSVPAILIANVAAAPGRKTYQLVSFAGGDVGTAASQAGGGSGGARQRQAGDGVTAASQAGGALGMTGTADSTDPTALSDLVGKSGLSLPLVGKSGLSLPLVRPILGRSGLIGRLSQADGYIVIDVDEEGVRQGEMVQVHLL